MDLSIKLQKTVTIEDQTSIDSINVNATLTHTNGTTTTTTQLKDLTLSTKQLELGFTLPNLIVSEHSTLHLSITPGGQIEISLKTFTGKTIPLSVKSHETVYEVKRKVFHKTGLYPSEQMLLFDEKLLEDFQTMGYYGIGEGSNVVVRRRGAMLVFVNTWKGECFVLEALGSDLVDDVKLQICGIEGIHPTAQWITVEGKTLLPYQTLEEANVNDGAVLHLLPRM